MMNLYKNFICFKEIFPQTNSYDHSKRIKERKLKIITKSYPKKEKPNRIYSYIFYKADNDTLLIIFENYNYFLKNKTEPNLKNKSYKYLNYSLENNITGVLNLFKEKIINCRNKTGLKIHIDEYTKERHISYSFYNKKTKTLLIKWDLHSKIHKIEKDYEFLSKMLNPNLKNITKNKLYERFYNKYYKQIKEINNENKP